MISEDAAKNEASEQNGLLNKKALVLSYVTVGYNVIEGIVSIAAGTMAGSIALTGFGFDSFIESLSGSIMIWRFSPARRSSHGSEGETETKAVRLIGYSFFILGVYVLYESISKLYLREKPDPSLIGIIIALVSCITMPALFIMKYKTGKAIGSKALVADSKETLACFFLSISLLIGLGSNYFFGLWWADPVVGIIVVLFLFHEGKEVLEGDDDD